MTTKKVKQYMLMLAWLCFSVSVLHAQKKSKRSRQQEVDTLTVMRDFISISNGYKQVPMYLDLDILNRTNFIRSAEDTATLHARFYLGRENSYVRVGEFEQVVNDSVALLVSDRLQQMIVYKNANPIVQKMKHMMGAILPDSSIRNLSKKYSASSKDTGSSLTTIELKSRDILRGTLLPKEVIELQYDAQQKQPRQVTTLKRTMVRLDSIQYATIVQREPGMADKLLTIEGSSFLIKEQYTSYVYNQIETLRTVIIPVTMNDRVAINKEGGFKPVKAYAAYRLITNN